MFRRKFSDNYLVNSLFFAFAVLLFHVVLLASIGFLVFIFRGIVNYFVWILLGCGVLAGAGLFVFYRFMQKEKSVVAEMMELPEFRDRRVEVSILGGLASFKIDGASGRSDPAVDSDAVPASRQLEDAGSVKVRELSELARLFEKNLISTDEYERAKNELLKRTE